MTVWVKGEVTCMSDYGCNRQVTHSFDSVEISDMLTVFVLQGDFSPSSFFNRPGYWELELGGKKAFLDTD